MKTTSFFVVLFFALTQVAYAQKAKIKEAELNAQEIAKIQDILKDADASTYSASFEQDGKVTRLGSASMRGLSTVSAYHKVGSGAKASNEIVTTVGDYIKTVWTSSFASKYPEKVKAIMAKSGFYAGKDPVSYTSMAPGIWMGKDKKLAF